MIRLCVGISSLNAAWCSLFDQLGVNIEKIDFSSPLENNYSCLIINSTLNNENKKEIYRYLDEGNGGVILCENVRSIFVHEQIKSHHPISLPLDYSNAIEQYHLGNGLLFSISFNPDVEFSCTKYKRKRFPFKKGCHPDEIVSSVNHENLRLTIEILIKKLHFHRNLPYVNKWHSPSRQPFFAFRVDTDYGSQDTIDELYSISSTYQVPITWFLHVKAHEEWMHHFNSLEKQEIALHGYEHGTSSSYEHIMNNIQQGKQIMTDAGLIPEGFCVPYAIWNKSLGDVLATFNFKYSSEFTLGYDTTPFHPIHNEHQHPTLQIPIHPICTGSLNRLNVPESEMGHYFKKVLDTKIKQLQNIIFYHHPMQKGTQLWKSIFEEVNKLRLATLTFTEIANFWAHRKEASLHLYFDKATSTLTCKENSFNYFLNVSVNFQEYFLLKASEVHKPLTDFNSFPSPKISYHTKEILQELNGNRFKLLKTSIFDWKNRKKL